MERLKKEDMPNTKKTSKQLTNRSAWPKPVVAKKAQPSNSVTRRVTAEQTAAGRPKTKTDRILALLTQPSGATLKAIMTATGWQSHSVRGFISGQLVKKMGLRVKSYRRDGERVYAIES